jgi:hypothetical protein
MKIALSMVTGIVLLLAPQARAQTPSSCTEAYNWCMQSERNFVRPSDTLGARCKRGREICMRTGNNPAQGLKGLRRE